MLDSGASPFRSVRYAERSRLAVAPRVAIVVVSVLLVLVLGSAAGVWLVANNSIRATSIAGLARADESVTNVLVVTTAVDGGAPDGVAVVQLSEQRERPAVLVLPVALEVDVPDLGTLTLADTPELGGTALLVEQVAAYTGLDLHHYLRVDRDALARLVDAGGGLDDCPSPDTEVCPRLIGDDVRTRLAPEDGVVMGADRVVAHLDVARVVGAELARLRTFVDPRRALRWSRGWDASLTSDVDPGIGQVRDLGRLLASVDPADVDVRILPGLVDDGRITVQPESSAVLLQAFADVMPLPDGVGIEAPRALVPEDVTLTVLNGVGRAGIAGDVADALTALGFVVDGIDNAPRFDPRAETVVTHRPSDEALAELVADVLPGAELAASDDLPAGVDVVVTVGVGGAP